MPKSGVGGGTIPIGLEASPFGMTGGVAEAPTPAGPGLGTWGGAC